MHWNCDTGIGQELAQLHVNWMLTTTTMMMMMMMLMMMRCNHASRFPPLPVIVFILQFSINPLNIYRTFPYTQQPLLLATLTPTQLLLLNPKQYNISNPDIMYVLCVHLYRTAISTNLFLHRKYTSKPTELQTIIAQNKFQVDCV